MSILNSRIFGKSQPPSGHTGVLAPIGLAFGGSGSARHQTEVGVDYLSVTIHHLPLLSDIYDRIEEMYSSPIFWDDPGHGYRGYQHQLRSEIGVVVAWGMGDSNHFHINFSGSFCRSAGALSVLRFVRWLESLECRVNYSRFDFCLDDYEKRQNCEGICQAIVDKSYCTRLKQIQGYYDLRDGLKCLGVNVGSRGGQSYIRMYDKSIESKGEIDSIRYELELRDERATLQLKALVALPENEWCDALIALFRATFDFVSYKDANHKERGQPLDWWLDITGGGEKSRLSIPRPKISVRRSVQWVHRQWSATFALLIHAFGFEQISFFLYRSSQEVQLDERYQQALADFLSFTKDNLRCPELCLT